MPASYAEYTGNGSTQTFSVPFPYILRAHVKLYTGYDMVAGTFATQLTEGTDYTWTSGTQVQTTVAPANGVKLTILRDTPDNALLTQWQDGSSLIAEDLITSDLQNLYVVQEQQDRNAAVAAQQIVTTALANATAAAVANVLLYDTVANVAAIPAAPANDDRVEVLNSTGIENFTPLAGMPNGFAGSSQLKVRLTYSTAGSTWNWVDYVAGDPDARYVRQSQVSSSATSTSTTNVANSAAVKTAKDAADAAQSAANAAQNTANTAVSNAAAAQGDATQALSDAAAAQGTANTAVSNAAAAQGTANTAVSNAAAAQSTADAALPKSGGTMTGVITFASNQPRLVTRFAVNASTAGTAIDFVNIPSWAKRITLMFDGVSTNGTSHLIVRLGSSSGIEATGYGASSVTIGDGVSPFASTYTTGFGIFSTTAANVSHGAFLLNNVAASVWTFNGSVGRSSSANVVVCAGSKDISGGPLDRIRVTTVNGTDSFDGGFINIMWEG